MKNELTYSILWFFALFGAAVLALFLLSKLGIGHFELKYSTAPFTCVGIDYD